MQTKLQSVIQTVAKIDKIRAKGKMSKRIEANLVLTQLIHIRSYEVTPLLRKLIKGVKEDSLFHLEQAKLYVEGWNERQIR